MLVLDEIAQQLGGRFEVVLVLGVTHPCHVIRKRFGAIGSMNQSYSHKEKIEYVEIQDCAQLSHQLVRLPEVAAPLRQSTSDGRSVCNLYSEVEYPQCRDAAHSFCYSDRRTLGRSQGLLIPPP
jgi:predicted phosphoribosyltransferase